MAPSFCFRMSENICQTLIVSHCSSDLDSGTFFLSKSTGFIAFPVI